jgi:hypothetical protein
LFFTIWYGQGEIMASPLTILVGVPGTPDAAAAAAADDRPDAAPAPASKRPRTAAVIAAAPPPFPFALPEHLLGRMPSALLAVAASYAVNDFRGVDRACARAAREATRTLHVRGEISDEQLRNVLLNHPKVRHFKLGETRTLTAGGLLAALKLNPGLETLTVGWNDLFQPGLLGELAHTHTRLARLNLPDHGFSDAELAQFADRLTHLEISNLGRAPRFTGSTLARCGRLRVLSCRATGGLIGDEKLPASLEILHLGHSTCFTGRTLPPALWDLSLDACSRFTGDLTHHPALRRLRLWGCPEVTPERLGTLVRRHPLLEDLTVDVPIRDETLMGCAGQFTQLALTDGSQLALADFRAFPRLISLDLGQCPRLVDENLPRGLRSLRLRDCGAIERLGSHLGALTDLGLAGCSGFKGFTWPATGCPPLGSLTLVNCLSFDFAGLPPTLRSLELAGGKAYTLAKARQAIRSLTSLSVFTYRDWSRGNLDPAEFLNHPSLQVVNYKQGPRSRQMQWRRPAPGDVSGPALPED